jgi:hypothetical protein
MLLEMSSSLPGCAMLRFACPACNAVMEAPAHKVGQKVACLKCGQRLQIPTPPRGTILAKPLPPKDSRRPRPLSPTPSWLPETQTPQPSSLPAMPQPENRPQEADTSVPMDVQPVSADSLSNRASAYGNDGRPRVNKPLVVVWCFTLGAVGTLVAGIVVFCLRTGPVPVSAAGDPATCRELAERLVAAGCPIRWAEHTDRFPALLIVRSSSDPGDETIRASLGRGIVPKGTAVILQCPSSLTARDVAVDRQPALCWGRFVIYGDLALLDEIRGRL